MTSLILAVCLMGFLILCFSYLTKNFGGPTEEQEPVSPFSKLIVVALLFMGSYVFVKIALNTHTHDGKKSGSLRSTYREKVLDEIIYNYEISKNQSQAAANGGKEKEVEVIPPNKITTTFKDVGGLHEAKEEVKDIVEFLKEPEKFKRLGAKSPKGALLFGPPGTGKTLLARAMAGEAKVPFIAVSGSEFEEEYVGVGAARIRQLFKKARKHAPCIVFIDEIDALAYKRDTRRAYWSAQTVNQLLAEMDGLDEKKNRGVIVIAASNRIDALDPAVLRPGRLDRHIAIGSPTMQEREEILSVYLKKVTIEKGITAKKIAAITSGFTSAELANLVNEATLIATKDNKEAVDIKSFETAKDRIVIGSKRKALKVTQKEKTLTAYHEAGHALVGHLLKSNHPALYKVTIMPRGQSLGHTSFEDDDDVVSVKYVELKARLATILGGRIAEEIVYGKQNITTGAESDLRAATRLAKSMVTKWGFSSRVGLVHYETLEPGKDSVIEEEVRAILESSYEETKTMVIKNRKKLDKLAKALIDKETLSKSEVEKLFA